MFIDKDFQFRVNISNDYYEKKTDATACLSRVGAKVIGKQKMAFREYDVTVDQFLRSALNGYTFCNLFEYDPNQLYWFETSAGKHYQSYPVYKDGPNKGCINTHIRIVCRPRFMQIRPLVERYFHGDICRFECRA